MTQNTHNARTRREQLSTYPESVCVGRYSGDTWQLELDGDDLDADRLVEGPVLYVRCDIAHQSQTEAEARGVEEQRRKAENAQGGEVVYLRHADYEGWCFCGRDEYDAVENDDDKHILYTRPANVATLEAEIASLTEAEQLARADAEASKARVKVLDAQLADMREAKKQAFNQGYLIACCNLTNLHDEPSIACDVLAECGLTEDDIKAADLTEYDAKALAKIRSARGGRDPIAALTREGGV
ncbi:hypothetical protein [Gluconobacter sp. Gdi]|uniref:hypothetical protein n=1 Tax=Gluconobacter sp. Gdi TaxID=2691888 RepID=UPI00174FD5E4|nr:hypothetical protein [Gluconobacter sp. Gdi]GFE97537.1 hypothetical protein DmGdi_26100 [Gluconobacter sp. Gdi]